MKSKYLDAAGQPAACFLREHRRGRDVDELIGLCRGILADGVIVQAEAEFLQHWLRGNQELIATYPANILYGRIEAMLCDGRFDPREEQELMGLLLDLTGGVSRAQIDPQRLATALPLDQPPPVVEFSGRRFCVTGKFASGNRREVQGTIETLGGVVQGNVTQSLDYLVVGLVGSRDWKHSTHGTKILKAVEYRDTKGVPLAIVNEEHWLRHLEA